MAKIIPVILCGGSGTRLWPLSREGMPKQFLNLLGDSSLLQQTALRALDCANAKPEDLVIVTLGSATKEVVRQMKELNPALATHVLSEPVARNTAAAVALAANYVNNHFGSDSVLWILPADHFVGDEKALTESLQKAVAAAQDDYLVTFGIKPTRPETGYGYISLSDDIGDGVRKAAQFVEKPNRETAEQYIASGDYLWNSGMFVFTAATILKAFFEHSEDTAVTVQRSMFASGGAAKMPSLEVYETIEEEPFDKAIMEKADRVAVVPCDPQWSDIGGYESLWELREKDRNGNVISGKSAVYGSKNCFVHSEERLVAVAGLDNIAVIETSDAILVTDKSNGDAMKMLVKGLKAQGAQETIQPPKESRPWGMFKILSETKGYKIKEIVVKPGEKLSLQMHHHRAEFWVVIEGEAIVTVGEEEKHMKAQDFVFIPLQATHRLANPGKTNLKIVEIQCGDYLGEDDIVRFDDVYGRSAAA